MTDGTPGLSSPSPPTPVCGNPFLLASGGAPSPASSFGPSLSESGGSLSTVVAAGPAPHSGNPFLLASSGAPPTIRVSGNPVSPPSGAVTLPLSNNPFLKGSASGSVVRPSGNPLLMSSAPKAVAAKKPELAKTDEPDEMTDSDVLSADVSPSVERYTFVKNPFFVCVCLSLSA